MSCLKVLNANEEEKFLEMYTISNYSKWLKENNYSSSYVSLRRFKAYCFAYVIENVCNSIKNIFEEN